MSDMKKYLKAVTQLNESVTDYNPKSQGGTRKELLDKFSKSKSSTDAEKARKAGATQDELKTAKEKVSEAAGDWKKEYGIRYKVFAGREGRLTTKEKWFATAAQLEKFAEKVENLGNFYEIDGYSYPQTNDALAADPIEEGRHDEHEWVQQLLKDKEASMAPANTGTPKRYKLIQNGNIVASYDTVDQATSAWQQLPPNDKGRTKIRESVNGVDVDVIMEMDAGATCSASIATAPAASTGMIKRVKEDDCEIEEASISNRLRLKQQQDYNLVLHGAMSKDEYQKKYKLGKYKEVAGKDKLAGPGGLYKNLVKGIGEGGESDFVGEPYRRDETLGEGDLSDYEQLTLAGAQQAHSTEIGRMLYSTYRDNPTPENKAKWESYEQKCIRDAIENSKQNAEFNRQWDLDQQSKNGLAESIKAAFEDYVKGKDTDEKCKVKITYKDGHTQTKLVTDKEKQRYETSASVDKVEVVKDGAARLDDAITESANVTFIGKFSKNGKNYSLWQKGDYWYELTRSSQDAGGAFKHVHEWHDTSVEEIQDELEVNGYTLLSASSVQEGEDWNKGLKSTRDEKVAKHNAAVAKMTKRSFANLDYSHPDLVKKAPKGHAFDVSHKVVKLKDGSVTENADSSPYHRVLVTLSDPNATMASKRGEKIQKHIRITGDLADAVNKAKAHYKKKGYRVHDAEVVDSYAISQEEPVNEISQKAKNDYIDAATGDYADANTQRQHDPKNAVEHEKRMAKRQKGLAMATGTDKDLRKIDELDNGPKGRVQTDKINYDARRGGSISPVKDQLEKNKEAEERQRADRRAADAAYKSANSKASRLADRQTEKIELNVNVPYDTIAKLARDYAGVNDIADVIDQRTYYTKIDGVVVAGIQLSIYASYDPSDFGYDQDTIDQMGGENLSDLIKLRFARDPKNPRKIIFTGYGA